MADSGLSSAATLLTNKVVIVLRSRCPVDAVVFDLVSELLDTIMYASSSVKRFRRLAWSHHFVVVVRCEGSVMSMLSSCKL